MLQPEFTQDYLGRTVAEGTLTKLGIRVWNLKKLLIGRAQSTSRPVCKQSVIKESRLACIADILYCLQLGLSRTCCGLDRLPWLRSVTSL